MEEFTGLQLMMSVLLTEVYIIYFASSRPFTKSSHNDWEIFNDSCVMIINYALMWLAVTNLDPEDRYTAGWFYIFICSFNLILNGLKVATNFFVIKVPFLYGKAQTKMEKKDYNSNVKKWLDKKLEFTDKNLDFDKSKLLVL